MIAPGSWNSESCKGKLSYYAPGKVLVVSHTPAVQAQVEAFLTQMKGAMSAERAEPPDNLVPATFSVIQPVMKSLYQPVQEPPRTPPTMPRIGSDRPKHRFHFSILYEGEGLVDNNVVDLIKAQAGVPSAPVPVSTPATCALAPCVTPAGLTLPTGVYLEHPPQYLPAPMCAPGVCAPAGYAAPYPPANKAQPAVPAALPSSAPAQPLPAAPKMPPAESN
jgi:hypothetical protein